MSRRQGSISAKWVVGRNLAKKAQRREYLRCCFSSLTFCCASEHLSPWISRGRLKAPVLLREYFVRAIAVGTLNDGKLSQPAAGEGRFRAVSESAGYLHFTYSVLPLARHRLLPFTTPPHTR
jgi:hypothetical protein